MTATIKDIIKGNLDIHDERTALSAMKGLMKDLLK